MRVEVVDNSRQRLELRLRTSVPLYAFFGLLFVALGVLCIVLLGVDAAGWLLGLVCVGSGAVILLAIQSVDLVADRKSGTLTLTRRLLLWPVLRRLDIALADITGVRERSSTLRTGRHIVTSYAVRLQLRDQSGDGTSLTYLPMFTESAAADVAQIIRAWLAGSRDAAGAGTAAPRGGTSPPCA